MLILCIHFSPDWLELLRTGDVGRVWQRGWRRGRRGASGGFRHWQMLGKVEAVSPRAPRPATSRVRDGWYEWHRLRCSPSHHRQPQQGEWRDYPGKLR